MSEPLRVAVVGLGLSGRYFHLPIIGAVPGLVVTAVVTSRARAEVDAALSAASCSHHDNTNNDGEVVAIAATVPGLIAEHGHRFDLCIVASPNADHRPHALALIAAGKHVVVEKPVALCAADAREIADAARASNVIASVYLNRRYDSDFLLLRELLGPAPRIGRVHRFEARWCNYRPVPRDRWREDDVPGAGHLFDLGPHLIDQCVALFGRPDRCLAELRRDRDGAKTCDGFSLLMRYDAAGLTCVIEASALVADGDLPRYIGARARRLFFFFVCFWFHFALHIHALKKKKKKKKSTTTTRSAW
jgi:predicted dehydrogenase